jgi:hypothetical protein
MSKNLNTILPFYDTKAEQNRWKEYVDTPTACQVICHTSTLVPFIIRRVHNTGTVANLLWHTYYSANDVELVDPGMSPWITAATELTIVSGSTYDYIIFDGSPIFEALPKGQFYFKISDSAGAKDWYSETVNVIDPTTLTPNGNPYFLRLQFSNDTQISNINTAFIQWVYLDAGLKVPEFIREDTGEKRDGLMVFEKRVLMKSDILHLVTVPEFMVDALMLLPLMDNVSLYVISNCYNYDEIQIKDPEWQESVKGSLAKLEIKLIGDVIIKKLNFKEMGCNCSALSGGSGLVKVSVGSATAEVPVTIMWSGTGMTGISYGISVVAYNTENGNVKYTIGSVVREQMTITFFEDCYYRVTATEE